MRFYIMCPYGTRTGGPEALHQLADSLNRNGQKAHMFYITPDEYRQLFQSQEIPAGSSISLPEKRECIPDYASYNAPSASEIQIDDQSVIVLPEIYTSLAKVFRTPLKLVWWLSVDNGLASLSQINLNYLRFGNVIHACQSRYAENFVTSVLGKKSIFLTDYTRTKKRFTYEGIQTKRAISINARPNKIIYPIDKLGELLNQTTGLEVYFLNGMPRRDVEKALESSFFYVDLANFPGLDRTPREALSLGAIPIILNAGAAKDFGFPQEWLLDNPDNDTVINTILSILDQYGTQILIAKNLAKQIANEREKFDNEVFSLVDLLTSAFKHQSQ